jgi:hypothetical protein
MLGVFLESVIGWIRQRKLVMSILAVPLVLALSASHRFSRQTT